MSSLAIRRLSPRIELKEYIKDIWLFESNGRLPEKETPIFIPNGSAKLMLYYEGQFTGRIGNRMFMSPEHKIFVLGVSDCPIMVEFDRGKTFGCICIEFKPAFAYRLLAVPQHKLRNMLVPFEELVNPLNHCMIEVRLSMTFDPVQKASLLQKYLIEILVLTKKDATFEYSASKILNSHGLISMAELSHALGQSDRWVRAKFTERLGISPKTFASIVRFHSCLRALLQNKQSFLKDRQFNDFYYDQAHFTKEFKRFIGYPPAKYASLRNEVGEMIYSHDL